MFKNVVTLHQLENIQNESGGYDVKIVSSKIIFSNEKSVWANEFYRAMQNDLKLKKVFVCQKMEYDDERVLEHDGKFFTVVRSYEKGEFVELSCTSRLGLFDEAII